MLPALSVVIVDGHAGARAALVARLQRMHTVQVMAAVDNVVEGLAACNSLAPDVVLYDPRSLPAGANTMALLQRMHKPVIVWTSSLVEGEAETLRQAGASAVLLKQSSLDPLLQAISTAARAA